MKLKMLKGEYVVVKLPLDFQISEQILKFDFYNLSKTSSELSLIIRNDDNFDYKKFQSRDLYFGMFVFSECNEQRGWRRWGLRFRG